ncbi:MAG: hypothetical protein NT162_00135 [Candidatus Woesebacteria bacterium]|nr:hypothetical protein [Candidatus Woesebacteria bacterium]
MNSAYTIPNQIIDLFLEIVKDWQRMFTPSYNYATLLNIKDQVLQVNIYRYLQK